MAYRDQPLGELALSIPRASALFRKYDMDYCCGGKQTLARAAARKELDVDVIEAELAKLAEQPIEKDWRSAPLAEIIDSVKLAVIHRIACGSRCRGDNDP